MLRERVSYGDAVLDARLPHVRELERTLISSLYCIDHGFNSERSGYTAAAFALSFQGVTRLFTADHNTHEGLATIIDPRTLTRREYRFFGYEPDTAVSVESWQESSSPLQIAEPSSGDINIALWLRYELDCGVGFFVPHVMWGTNIGRVSQSHKDSFWGFHVEGEEKPHFGDSGALMLTITPGIEPKAIGIFRGFEKEYGNMKDICVFSPLPFSVN